MEVKEEQMKLQLSLLSPPTCGLLQPIGNEADSYRLAFEPPAT
jgi:hypothetical protein